MQFQGQTGIVAVGFEILPVRDDANIRFEDVHRTPRSESLSEGQKKRLRKRRLEWDSCMGAAKRYLIKYSLRGVVHSGDRAPWFADPAAMSEAQGELDSEFNGAVPDVLRSTADLQDLAYDPDKGLIVQVEGWLEPLIEVRLHSCPVDDYHIYYIRHITKKHIIMII